MNVLDDQSQSIQSAKPPYTVEYPKPPTAILAPPPTPMGGPMVGPSVPVGMSTSPTPIMMPPPTPIGSSMAGPPALVRNNETNTNPSVPTPNMFSQISSQSSVPTYSPPDVAPTINVSTAAPPMISAMTPPFPGGPPPSKGYPKPSSYVPMSNSSSHVGMDPTAPITMKAAPIGPPPMGGFIRK